MSDLERFMVRFNQPDRGRAEIVLAMLQASARNGAHWHDWADWANRSTEEPEEEWARMEAVLDASEDVLTLRERRRIGQELIDQSLKLKDSHGKNQNFLWAIRVLEQEGKRIVDGRPPIHPTSTYMPQDVAVALAKARGEEKS